MVNITRAAILALVALLPSAAAAQAPVTLSPTNPARWDAGLSLGWFGGNKSESTAGHNNWYDAPSVDGSVGYYWTPNLKLDFDVATTSEGDVYVFQLVDVPGTPYPQYRGREHRVRATRASFGAAYQFFENAWFHPFVGGGAMVVHETERAGVSEPWLSYRGPQDFIVVPPLPPLSESSTTVRPYLAGGFKAYASERVFFRTDLRVAASSARAESVVWRAGIGVDF